MSNQTDDRRATGAVAHPMPDELVLLDPMSGTVHRLSGVTASMARRLLDEGTALAGPHPHTHPEPTTPTTSPPARSNGVRLSLVAEPVERPVLGPREEQVLHLLAAGHSNESIARTLHYSVATVRRTTSSIYRCLGARNRASAIARAHELRLLA